MGVINAEDKFPLSRCKEKKTNQSTYTPGTLPEGVNGLPLAKDMSNRASLSQSLIRDLRELEILGSEMLEKDRDIRSRPAEEKAIQDLQMPYVVEVMTRFSVCPDKYKNAVTFLTQKAAPDRFEDAKLATEAMVLLYSLYYYTNQVSFARNCYKDYARKFSGPLFRKNSPEEIKSFATRLRTDSGFDGIAEYVQEVFREAVPVHPGPDSCA